MWRPVLALILSVTLAGAETRAETRADSPTADTAAKAEQFRTGYATWLDQVGAQTGVMALRYQGQPVATLEFGRAGDQPHDLASLSKAITGVCIAALVDEGRLTYDTHAREILSLPRAAPVSIAQLLTHGSGLHADHTQGPMAVWRNDPTPRWSEVADRAMTRKRIGRDKSYYYSNENYAVLGAVIEAVTGQPYETACRDRVLTPAGVTGAGSDLARAFLPWGGWDMSLPDYAAFYDYAFGAAGVLTPHLRELPRSEIVPSVHYGMGVMQRDRGAATNVWHFGALCFHDGPNFGSYAVHHDTGWTITAWWDACITGEEMFALDQAMVNVSYDLQ